MRAMNDTISKFSALAFRNKRILYLSQKSDFRRYSSEIQCFWILFHQNTVISDVITQKYNDLRSYSTKIQ